MKKRILTIAMLMICAVPMLTAQTSETPYTTPKDTANEPLVVFRDRLVMDIYHTFWMNMPVEVNHLKFDPGFTVSAIWDFKIKKKPIAVGLGVGVSYYTQFSNALLRYDETSGSMMYYILPTDLKYNLLKMNYLNVNIPLEFRYRHPNGFKFSVGVRAGLVCEVSQKSKGNDPAMPSDTAMYKNLLIKNKTKYNIDVYTRIGWKFIDLYYCFQPIPLFADAKGPKIYPMSLGISLSIF